VTTVLRHNVDVLVNQTASAGKCADSFTLPHPHQHFTFTRYCVHTAEGDS